MYKMEKKIQQSFNRDVCCCCLKFKVYNLITSQLRKIQEGWLYNNDILISKTKNRVRCTYVRTIYYHKYFLMNGIHKRYIGK